MSKSKFILLILVFAICKPILAREIASVKLEEQANIGGTTVILNGAGIRTKFVFDIYVGALYLTQKTTDAKQAIAMAGAKRISMHFLYDEVEKEKLTDGWNDGFENNLSDKDFASLKARLDAFNKLFVTVKKGDVIQLDYIPGKGTQVTINQQTKGSVPGEDFQQALLRVWLGDDPADEDLKTGMLGKQNQD
ncbi:MAG: chalcone isomerase family protein [Gammaproteobacteria bacterium]|nr:chalcone isomerase family protein [Gammaproteobacteria bacterium]